MAQKGQLQLFDPSNLKDYINRNYYINPVYAFGQRAYDQEEFRQYIILWAAYYYGYDADFHDYTVYNGNRNIEVTRRTLNMAKKVCEDKADLLMNEKVAIACTEDGAQDTLDRILEFNDFRSQSNELIEFTNALGTGAYVEYVKDGDVCIDYLTADKIIPLEIRNSQVVSAAFASPTRYMDTEAVYFNAHIRVRPFDPTCYDDGVKMQEDARARLDRGIPLDYDGYVVENKILVIKNNAVKEYPVGPNTPPVYLTGTTIPFFQIITPAKANNIVLDDIGLGMSAYSNALDDLRGVDLVYDSFINEFQLGVSKMFVHDDLAQIQVETEGGNTIMRPRFDHRNTVFYALDMGQNEPEQIKYIQSELRIEPHEAGLNKQLNIVGLKCGMGPGFYKFEQGTVKTATEVVSDNNPLYKSIKKDQHILRHAVTGVARACLYLASEAGLGRFNAKQDITVDFDDSIFEDTETIRKNALVEFNSGLIDEIEYFMIVYKMTEEQAKKKVEDIRKRRPAEEDVDDDPNME